MYKQSSLVFLIILICFKYGYSQITPVGNNEIDPIRNAKTKLLFIGSPDTHLFVDNIHDIIVEDARPDTNTIGFLPHRDSRPTFLILNGGIKNKTQEFVNSYLHSNNVDSSMHVLMV